MTCDLVYTHFRHLTSVVSDTPRDPVTFGSGAEPIRSERRCGEEAAAAGCLRVLPELRAHLAAKGLTGGQRQDGHDRK